MESLDGKDSVNRLSEVGYHSGEDFRWVLILLASLVLGEKNRQLGNAI